MTVPDLSTNAKLLVNEGRLALRPSTLDKERIHAALQSRLALNPELADVQTPATSIGGAVLSKAIVGAMVFLVIAGAVYFLQHPRESDVAAVAVESSPKVEALELEPTVAIVSAAASVPEPTRKASVPPSLQRAVAAPGDKLGEEATLLMRAEKEYHSGKFVIALQLVDEHARKFPAGVLRRERVELRDRVLCGLASDRRRKPNSVEVAELGADREPSGVTPCER